MSLFLQTHVIFNRTQPTEQRIKQTHSSFLSFIELGIFILCKKNKTWRKQLKHYFIQLQILFALKIVPKSFIAFDSTKYLVLCLKRRILRAHYRAGWSSPKGNIQSNFWFVGGGGGQQLILRILLKMETNGFWSNVIAYQTT